jgi:hypothetical protein
MLALPAPWQSAVSRMRQSTFLAESGLHQPRRRVRSGELYTCSIRRWYRQVNGF